MKKLVIAVIALALLGGGGFGAYTFFNKPAEANETKEAAKAAEAAKPAGEEVKPSFVELKALVLPVIDQNGVSQVVSIVVSLEADNPANVEEIKLLTPRLTDAYIQGMYGVLSSKQVMDQGVLQVGYIKARLNAITTKVLGENKVKDVLLQVVQQRRV